MGSCFGSLYDVDDEDVVGAFKERNLTVRRVASKEDPLFARALDVAARSFCGSTTSAPEGMLDWAFAGASAGGVPLKEAPTEARRKWFKWLLTWSLTKALSFGGAVYVLLEESERVVAATAVYPPTVPTYGTTRWQFLSLALTVGAPPDADGKPGALDRLNAVEGVTSRLHETHAAEPHLFVYCFAVDPDVQGKGVGSVLLRFVCRLADKLQCPAYLETSGQRNQGFYSAKGGFSLAEAATLTSKDDAKNDVAPFVDGCLGMLRPAAAATAAGE
mmetsp:Transcript_6073/g.19068  ORF Transcript_6073/g.19068 Transcript_6073/m.19068 type:complete len:274 (-) Transcript_6073:205-1026(-)